MQVYGAFYCLITDMECRAHYGLCHPWTNVPMMFKGYIQGEKINETRRGSCK